MAQDATVCAGHGLLTLRDAGPFAGASWADALQLLLALAALWDIWALLDILIDETSTWGADTGMKK